MLRLQIIASGEDFLCSLVLKVRRGSEVGLMEEVMKENHNEQRKAERGLTLSGPLTDSTTLFNYTSCPSIPLHP